jgi:translin
MNNLESIAEQIRKNLSVKDEAREKMLPLCRDSIRFSGNAIRAVHRQEFKEAADLLQNARSLISEAEKAVAGNRELASGGMIRDAHKEFAEATITLAVVNDKPLPDPTSLGVDAAAYLNGLGEAAGELRRYLLDSMRKGDLSRGEELLSVMDDIYSTLVTMDYPDAITGGLRRTTDMVRGVLERTRSDLTLTMRQQDLEKKLGSLPDAISDSIEEAMSEESLSGTQPEEPTLDSGQMDVYNALVEWREKRATEENLTASMIARNSALKEIIKMNPSRISELMEIKGFGERRANKYGRDIIKILKKWL